MAEKAKNGNVSRFLAECSLEKLDARHRQYCLELATLEEFLTRPGPQTRQPARLARYRDLQQRLIPQVQRQIMWRLDHQDGSWSL